MSEVIQTQAMGLVQFWLTFIFFISLSVVFMFAGKNHKREMVLLHMLIMCISLLIAGVAMIQYDLLFTLCFVLFQVISWIMNLMMVKI